jgi:hypothetical protein
LLFYPKQKENKNFATGARTVLARLISAIIHLAQKERVKFVHFDDTQNS